jgi:hypothetical protein
MNGLYAVIAALIGGLFYLLVGNPNPASPPGVTAGKIAELGRLLFLGAIIGLMVAFASRPVHLF